LIQKGYEVLPVLSAGGSQFVSSRVLETFCGRTALSPDPFDPARSGTDHIAVARWADLFVVYGATADFIARYAHGLADDTLCLQLIATRAPVILAPAMNPAMWEHPSVQENIRTLSARGIQIVGPISGKVACGETGVGHITDHAAILSAIDRALGTSAIPALQGKRVLISAGPMRTQFDPVRFLQNRSSGKMGLALARAARQAGACVQVLLGPVESSMATVFGAEFETHRYEGAADYQERLDALFPGCDIFFSAAAVLDFDIQPAPSKLERAALSGGELSVKYAPVPDLVAKMAGKKAPHQRVIAFAAETGTNEKLLTRAREKLIKKKTDALIANPVRDGLGPDSDRNELWVIRPTGEPVHLGPDSKDALAFPLLQALFDA
jgi:phosphopantothenoylcysteine decarboxylase/phosphopantothenate--cysteine ligase